MYGSGVTHDGESKETDARIVIDRLLREAGWDIESPAMVSTEEAAADGRADYLLKNSRTQPLSVLEAKRFSTDPYGAKEKSKSYAVSLGAPFVLLSNGREHYLWEYDTGDARPILGFPSQADLERRTNLRFHRQGDLATSLRAIPLPTRFRFKGDEVEARPYQLDCNTWIAEHSESINPDQAHMLRLLRNVVIAAAAEKQYQTLEPEVFNHPAFRRLGGLRKIEGIFGKQRLSDILDELRQLLEAA